jgi:Xaa-Pro aminopeptidase
MPVVSFGSGVEGDEFLREQLEHLGVKRLGFESNNLTYGGFERLAEKLTGIELVSAKDPFGKLRMIKTPDELEKIRTACRFADKTFEYMLSRVQAGRTEQEVHLDLEFFIRRHGYGLAFPPIVVSGERSARPHGVASQKIIQDGDFVTMDFGATVEGYSSDLTRTVVVGKATDRHWQVYEQVLKAETTSIEIMKPGIAAKEVAVHARTVLDEKDLAQFFQHGLGHGLGSLVHDSGRLSVTSEEVLEVGQVWTVEPGVYIEGFGGVRIEDDVVITSDGNEVLTHSPKELLEIA